MKTNKASRPKSLNSNDRPCSFRGGLAEGSIAADCKTNGFSKKVENHIAAVSLHFMYYNFVRIHQSLRMTPAMAAGVTGKLWEVKDLITLLEEWTKRRTEQRMAEYRERVMRSYSPF